MKMSKEIEEAQDNLRRVSNMDGLTQWDWTQAVAQRTTLLGYWPWVAEQLDMGD